MRAREDSGSVTRRLVATYERVIGASVERVLENALDWEHLPWLHAGSFTSITVLETGADFWRARVGVRALVAYDLVLELRLDASRRSYVTRTLEGAGRGTEIRTALEALDERRTAIKVEFHVAGPARHLGDALGVVYTRLYERLWSEDEAMMRHRQAYLDARAARAALGNTRALDAITLGDVGRLRARLPAVVETPRGPYRVVALGPGGALAAHAATCPHLGGPLADAKVTDGTVTCPWHGYGFDVRSGRSTGAHRCRLPPAPEVVVDAATAEARLEWPRADADANSPAPGR